MKIIAIFSVLVVATMAAPQLSSDMRAMASAPRPIIPIVRMVQNSDNAGRYDLDILSGDQTVIKEEGVLKDLGDKEGPVSVKTGSYAFTAPDGHVYSVRWTSDEKGFVPTGEHLPTPPPIPAEILRALEFNSQEEARAGERRPM